MKRAPMGMSAIAYAKHRSVVEGRTISRQTVDAAKKRGALPLLPGGMIDVARADREWAIMATGRPSKQPPLVTAPGPTPQAPESTTAPTKVDGEEDDIPTASRSKQIKAGIEAQRELKRWRIEQGEIVERTTHDAALTAIGVAVRKALQSLPRQMQAEMMRHIRCANCGGNIDGKSIAIAAEKHVDGVLRALADEVKASSPSPPRPADA